MIGFVDMIEGGTCWVKRMDSGKCKELFSKNLSKEECCTGNQDFGYTDHDILDVEFFFATSLGNGANCVSCFDSCDSAKCGPGKRCAIRKGRPKCICAPVCKSSNNKKRNKNLKKFNITQQRQQFHVIDIKRNFDQSQLVNFDSNSNLNLFNSSPNMKEKRSLSSELMEKSQNEQNKNRKSYHLSDENIDEEQSELFNNIKNQRKLHSTKNYLNNSYNSHLRHRHGQQQQHQQNNEPNKLINQKLLRKQYLEKQKLKLQNQNFNKSQISVNLNSDDGINGNLPLMTKKKNYMITNTELRPNTSNISNNIKHSNSINNNLNRIDLIKGRKKTTNMNARNVVIIQTSSSLAENEKKVEHKNKNKNKFSNINGNTTLSLINTPKNHQQQQHHHKNHNNKNKLDHQHHQKQQYQQHGITLDEKIRNGFFNHGFPYPQTDLMQVHQLELEMLYGNYANPVCGTDGRTYKTECQLKKRACRRDSTTLVVAYRGYCQTSCKSVQCLSGLTCVEDQYGIPHCIKCTINCPQDDSSYALDLKRAVCGVDGRTYKSVCDINRQVCLTGRSIAVAYNGPCKDESTCENIRCGPKKTCLTDLITHKPKCVSCSFKCPRKRKSQTGRYADIKICGNNNHTYNSWCHMKKDSCNTELYIDVKHTGPCNKDSFATNLMDPYKIS